MARSDQRIPRKAVNEVSSKIKIPRNMLSLKRDKSGLPIPFFVVMESGIPEFRVADGRKALACVQHQRCWICGKEMEPGRSVFVVGPSALLNRVSAEPPSHSECARYAVRVCPFMSNPDFVRRKEHFPDGTISPGLSIKENPGVMLLWYASGYKIESSSNGGGLFIIPNPSKIVYFRHGRKATGEEIQAALKASYDRFVQASKNASVESNAQLHSAFVQALKMIPK